jgi:hypothetical protein
VREKFEVTDDRIILMMPYKPLPLPEIYLDPDFIKTTERYEEMLDCSYESKTIVGYVNNIYHKIQ